MADGGTAITPASPPAAAAEEVLGVEPKKQQRKAGLVSRVWKGIFGGKDDFEKLLQTLSREEAAVHARLKRRARAHRRMSRNVVALSAAMEVVAVAYAIMTTRSPDLSWQIRAIRVLPMFLLPVVAALIYSMLNSLKKMLDKKDQNTLEKLRAQRQAKIDELKERTNYYTTQQLIQRYDPDPASKAAAATVLASKLGADSGLKVFVGDESNTDSTVGRSNDVQLGQSTGLRQRRAPHATSNSTGSSPVARSIDDQSHEDDESTEGTAVPNERIFEHYKGSVGNEGGWLARLAALLVGEDPTQCYALICGNCHMHNGLARKEDFPYITYYCPHCHALNGSRQPEENGTTPTSEAGGGGGHPTTASETSPIVSSLVASALATVQELPAEVSEEKVGSEEKEGNAEHAS